MRVVEILKRLVGDADATANSLGRAEQKLDALVAGSNNQQYLLNQKLSEVVIGLNNQSDLFNRRLNQLIAAMSATPAANGASAAAASPLTASQGVACSPRSPGLEHAASPGPSPGLAWPGGHNGQADGAAPARSGGTTQVNRMEEYATLFDGIVPWSGDVPKGYLVDFTGTLLDARFRTMFGIDPETVGGGFQQTRLPTIEDGEGWFEAADWVLAAREARGSFAMMTLGACYGAQAVGSYRVLQHLNPMPCKLVAVEPDPENCEWVKRHFRDNGIDPEAHWLVQTVLSDRTEPVLFPIGSPGTGAQNCFSTNEAGARTNYANDFIKAGRAAEALSNLLLHNTTGIIKALVPGEPFMAEIKLVSAITLRELLGPFDRVDYLEADIQQSEILVFPPFIDLLRKKVRRIHIGTHGQSVHWSLHDLFATHGWEIVFSFEPNARHETALGSFETNDGVLTVRNPDL
jgi:hypothetical protein